MLVVKDLNLTIGKGEFLTMLGPSGSGKTTCLMMLAGFETATHGEIRLDGQPINNIPPHKRGIGMVFQNYALFPHMTVAENLAFPLEVRKMGKSTREAKVKRALDMVQMGAFGGRRPAQLSGGQQQRVALARALVFEPELVLMDEPLGALDKQLREHMQFEIKHIARQSRHHRGLRHPRPDRGADHVGPRRGVRRRRIQQLDPPDVLYEQPKNSFVAQFIGENNTLMGKVEKIDKAANTLRSAAGRRRDHRRDPGQCPRGRRARRWCRSAPNGSSSTRTACRRRPYAEGRGAGVHLHGRHLPHPAAGRRQRRLHRQDPQRARPAPPDAGRDTEIGWLPQDCRALDA